jgi:hypothetical protein
MEASNGVEAYTRVPNSFFEMMADMTDIELRVVLALIRLICGFHKSAPEPVSYTQLMQMTGMTKPAVIKAIRQARARGVVQSAGRGKRGVHLYTLSFTRGDAPATESASQRSTMDTSESATGKPCLPELVNDIYQNRSTAFTSDTATGKPHLPDDGTTGKPCLPELVNGVYPQKKRSKEKIPEANASGRQEPPGANAPGRAPVQPHITLIDAYLAGLDAAGRKPIETNPYTRRVRIATAMVKSGVTAEQVRDFVAHVYDPANPDAFWRERSKPIPLETVAEQLPGWLARQRAASNQSRNGGTPSADAALWSHILNSLSEEHGDDERPDPLATGS